ncbi:MAG: hypothetical protein QM759_09080 [Terricaulis sp.]
MKSIIGALMAAVVATTAFAPAASARDYHRGHYYSYGHRGHGNAAAAGVFGLVLGAALGASLSSNHHRYSDRGYYRDRYYDDGYYDDGYGYGRGVCIVREHRYDPYRGRDVFIEERRSC